MKKAILNAFFGKGGVLFLAVAYAALVTVGATFSWVTSSAQKPNDFAGEMELTAIIDEDFEQQQHWQPGTDVTKTVSVHNGGKSAGFARISFEEILRLWEVSDVSEPFSDPEEAGVTPEYCLPSKWDTWENAGTVFSAAAFFEGANPVAPASGVTVKVKTSSAGIQRYQYAIYQKIDGGQAYRRMTAQFSVSGNTLTILNPRYWGFQSSAGQSLEAAWGLRNRTGATVSPPLKTDIAGLIADRGKKIKINYAHLVTALTDRATDEGNWFYNEADGFFYYIGTVEPGRSSGTLMTGLSLDAGADLSYSLMKLEFIINMQALQVNADALSSVWGINGQLLSILSSFC